MLHKHVKFLICMMICAHGFGLSGVRAQNSCLSNTAPSIVAENGWEWAASIDWVAHAQGFPAFYQEWIVDYWVCLVDYRPLLCSRCGPPFDYCDSYVPHPIYFLLGTDMLGFQPPWQSPGAYQDDIEPLHVREQLCPYGECHLFAATKGPITESNIVVVHGIIEDVNQPGEFTYFSDLLFYDPDSGNPSIKITFVDLLTGNNDYLEEEWAWYRSVCGFEPTAVSISDIGGFWLESQDTDNRLGYRITDSADPADSAAVYISDNPLGPARLIEGSVKIPIIDDSETPPLESNYWHHTPITTYMDNYYYFLNHDTGPFDRVMKPVDLYANEDNAINWSIWSSTDRPTYSAPSNLIVSDEPLDAGGTIHLAWDLSVDDASLDHYNVYRQESESGFSIHGFQYVCSLAPGTTLYTDTTVFSSFDYSYKVSSAHHGSEALSSGDGNFGIWNDFSAATADFTPVHDFANMSISSAGGDSLFMCPGDDYEALDVTLVVQASNSAATVGVPATDIILWVFSDSVFTLCEGDTLYATQDTDANGETSFITSAVGGCGPLNVVAEIQGSLSNILPIFIRSPDRNGDGIVNSVDLGFFATAYGTTSCAQEAYDACFDYNDDCRIDVLDLGIYADHAATTHRCP